MNDLSTLKCHNLALITINLNNSDFPPYYEANGSEEKRLEMPKFLQIKQIYEMCRLREWIIV